MMSLLMMLVAGNAGRTSQLCAPMLHGGQPGLDDWLPVLAFVIGLVLAIGLAVHNLKKQRPAPSDKPLREHDR